MQDKRIDWQILLRSYAADPARNVGLYQQHCSPKTDEIKEADNGDR